MPVELRIGSLRIVALFATALLGAGCNSFGSRDAVDDAP
jgi:hypothetical protein